MMEEFSGTECLCRIDGKYVLFLHIKTMVRWKVEKWLQTAQGIVLSDTSVLRAGI